MSVNPFARVRHALKKGSGDMSIVVGCSVQVWSAHERGMVAQPSQKVLAGLKRLGFDPKQLAEAFVRWREEQQEQRIEQMQAEIQTLGF